MKKPSLRFGDSFKVSLNGLGGGRLAGLSMTVPMVVLGGEMNRCKPGVLVGETRDISECLTGDLLSSRAEVFS